MKGRTQMDGINPVKTFLEAGVLKNPCNAEEVLEVPDHRTIDGFAPSTLVKVKERGRLALEHGAPYDHALNEGKAAMVDGIGNGGEGKVRMVDRRPGRETYFRKRIVDRMLLNGRIVLA